MHNMVLSSYTAETCKEISGRNGETPRRTATGFSRMENDPTMKGVDDLSVCMMVKLCILEVFALGVSLVS